MKHIYSVTMLILLLVPINSLAKKKAAHKKSSTSQTSKDPVLKSTIYCTETVTGQGCNTKSSITDSTGKVLISVCPKEKNKCILEGACYLQNPNGQIILVNYVGKTTNSYFKIVDMNTCPYGLGVNSSCLDPYYTVAADASYHKAGDVIYIEKLRGLALPDGTNHTGFMIVRDVGKKIKGPDRFDFFSGDNCDVQNPELNPFAKVNLQSENSKIPYKTIKNSEEIKRIQAARSYPHYPHSKSSATHGNYIQQGLEEIKSVDSERGGQ
jgi:3D (Asp-Asp-Asp) domain-containing protein